VVEHFVARKWFGGAAPQLAIEQAQAKRELASKRAQRAFRDQHTIKASQLRSFTSNTTTTTTTTHKNKNKKSNSNNSNCNNKQPLKSVLAR
jgi:CRISPR/Cas system CSM-associated protein Csm2 small subunit